MSFLSLGNCEGCWDNPCTCGKKSYSETSLNFMRSDELEALQAKITKILASRNQSVHYAAHTQGKIPAHPMQNVVTHMASALNPLKNKHGN